ncbi:MAG: ribonuclease III [Bacilli bacterium]
MSDIKELLKSLSIEPQNLALYNLALTHSSYNADAKTKHHDYERLEYIGDAVLGFVVADLIYHHYENMEPGEMSKLRSYIVKSKSLADYARKLELHKYILAGHSIDHNQIRSSDKILEDTFESLVGAIYLDLGINAAYKYISSIVKEQIVTLDLDVLTDYKTKLQEEMQAEYRNGVHYRLVSMTGPAHERHFVCEVLFNDLVLAKGEGKSKKAAEENAAKNALAKRSV